jgi:hypothetical protein
VLSGPVGGQITTYYYDPRLGRFREPDALGQAPRLNLYAYVEGNPVNGVDQAGLSGNPNAGGANTCIGMACQQAFDPAPPVPSPDSGCAITGTCSPGGPTTPGGPEGNDNGNPSGDCPDASPPTAGPPNLPPVWSPDTPPNPYQEAGSLAGGMVYGGLGGFAGFMGAKPWRSWNNFGDGLYQGCLWFGTGFIGGYCF